MTLSLVILAAIAQFLRVERVKELWSVVVGLTATTEV